jgi:hypothetical protein
MSVTIINQSNFVIHVWCQKKYTIGLNQSKEIENWKNENIKIGYLKNNFQPFYIIDQIQNVSGTFIVKTNTACRCVILPPKITFEK